MMTQTAWVSPKFTIDCMLANGNSQLEADGCVLECGEDGHTLSSPDHLRVGDTVNVQLWVEGEESFIDIRLAIITKVHKHWVTLEVIRMSPNDRMRLKRSTASIEEPAHIDHLLIRA
jgi:hypothetical protein